MYINKPKKLRFQEFTYDIVKVLCLLGVIHNTHCFSL